MRLRGVLEEPGDFGSAGGVGEGLGLLWGATAELNKDGRMVRGFLQSSGSLIDLATFQPFGQSCREQKVVNSNAAVVLKGLSEVIPKCKVAALPGV